MWGGVGGGGGAPGARAAYEAKRSHPDLVVCLAVTGRFEDGGSTNMVASEALGINAPFNCEGDGDTPEVYLEDILQTGGGLGDPVLCRILAQESADRVRELEALGVPFTRRNGHLEQQKLSELIEQTIFAVSTNESRPVYMGSLFELDENRLTVVSVDGYRLALRRAEVNGKTQSASFIVPGSVLQDVARLCSKGEDPVMIDLGERHVSFTIGDTVVVSRLLEGEFINYRKTIPENFKYKLGVNRGEMLSATDRVSLVVDETVKSPIRLVFSDSSIDFRCGTALGTARDVCPCEGNGGDTEIGFNGRYLRDALRAAPTDELTVCINTGSAPCVIVPADGSDEFVYMVLPVRLAK